MTATPLPVRARRHAGVILPALAGLLLLAGLPAEERPRIELPLADTIDGTPVPPSPADPEHYPGHHLYELPRFTHWPAIVYADERRNGAFHLPVPQPGQDRRRRDRQAEERPEDLPPPADPRAQVGWQGGQSGQIGWLGGEALPLTLPADPEIKRCSGLLDLPTTPGLHTAEVAIGAGRHRFSLRLVPVDEPWPLAGLVAGHPVDDDGVPTVLIGERIDPAEQRRWEILRQELARPDGPVLVVGDPLTAPDGDTWTSLREAAVCRPAIDQRYPHHAALVALAGFAEGFGDPAAIPRTIVWSPGNACLHAHTWSTEESRLLDLVRTRCEGLGVLPRLVLVLPPLPVDPDLQERARERRRHLRTRAGFTDWQVLDAERLLADVAEPNRIAAGAYARYPFGAAREQLAAGLAREILAD